MPFLIGSIIISLTLLAIEWHRSRQPIHTVLNIIPHLHPLGNGTRADSRHGVKNCRWFKAYLHDHVTRCGADEPEDVIILERLCDDLIRRGRRDQVFGYSKAFGKLYEQFRDRATDYVSNVEPPCTLALKQAL